ncbi:hypothetical protein [Pseudomonas sp. GW101-3H06]|jgi:hypothetical protein|uniref:hypothetical protein n=1 Tax=Pseudomonas sp. GW101-3H06 TaxID=2751347 RepID=UPI00216AE089|nr:hypothetical protein [Pseudomonas sp. GW101-3H06]
MGWDRQAAPVMNAPAPIVLGRWVLAAVIALLVSVLLFLLHAAERVPPLQALNIWVLAGAPLLVWLLTFSARAYGYGSALDHHQFLEDEAQYAQGAWQEWAQRYLAVHASCVLLPEQVSTSALMQGAANLPLRTGQARRIVALPSGKDRAAAGLRLLVTALATTLQALPVKQELRVTLLSDAMPAEYDALRDTLKQIWASENCPQLTAVTLSHELSFQWVDEVLKAGSAAFEVLLVLQVNAKASYSDGLAALLLCPDNVSSTCGLPVLGALLRPMPLDITDLHNELPQFFQTQTNARLASGLLADSDDWQPVIGEIFANGNAQDSSLKVDQQWVQEALCGVAGPLNHWLTMALGTEMVRHRHQPLLLLTKEKSQHWISTMTKREML